MSSGESVLLTPATTREIVMDNVCRLVRTPTLPIYKIIYHSRITIAGDAKNRQFQIAKIIDWSNEWNVKHAVTGALMLSDDKFSQVFEGPSHAVKSLFGHISCDRRHTDVTLLQSDYFAERDFGNWSMAYAGTPGSSDITMAASTTNADPRLGTGAKSVISLLRWLLLDKPP